MTEVQERLGRLRVEYDTGRHELALLDRRREEVRDALLRIGGAIQVLEELVAGAAQPPVAVLQSEAGAEQREPAHRAG